MLEKIDSAAYSRPKTANLAEAASQDFVNFGCVSGGEARAESKGRAVAATLPIGTDIEESPEVNPSCVRVPWSRRRFPTVERCRPLRFSGRLSGAAKPESKGPDVASTLPLGCEIKDPKPARQESTLFALPPLAHVNFSFCPQPGERRTLRRQTNGRAGFRRGASGGPVIS